MRVETGIDGDYTHSRAQSEVEQLPYFRAKFLEFPRAFSQLYLQTKRDTSYFVYLYSGLYRGV